MSDQTISRRTFLRYSAALAAAAGMGSILPSYALAGFKDREALYPYGPDNVIDLTIGHVDKHIDGKQGHALGINGTVESNLFISQQGNISAAIEGEYDMPITQHLFLQPRLAVKAAIQEFEKYGVDSGLNNIETGLRLQYQIRREFAPYLGISWNRKLGTTADLVREEGEQVGHLDAIGGIRMWF